MKCVTVVGTRPEFIQTSRLSWALRARHTERLVNTGQHYDDLMSQIFFRELDLPTPDVSLGVGVEGAGHAAQTANILLKIEPLLEAERPDWVVVFGDTNSTIAAALAAAKLRIPVAHVEAGLRSFDRAMPEEVNRVLTDHASDLWLAPTAAAVDNLANEGIRQGVLNVGDVRVDVLAHFAKLARPRQAALLGRCNLRPDEPFALCTIHRASNTDDGARLEAIVQALDRLQVPVLLPVHPRLAKMLARFGVRAGERIRTTEPLGYLDMLAAIEACRLIVTDSGGLQKEAYIMRRPCVTVRDTTEWIETVQMGWNRLAEPPALAAAAEAAMSGPSPPYREVYGPPGVSDRIVDALERGRAQSRAAG